MTTVSETLRCALGKDISLVDNIIVACHGILQSLQKDAEEFNDHVTHVSTDIRNYVRDQKERVADDATVGLLPFNFLTPTVAIRVQL